MESKRVAEIAMEYVGKLEADERLESEGDQMVCGWTISDIITLHAHTKIIKNAIQKE